MYIVETMCSPGRAALNEGSSMMDAEGLLPQESLDAEWRIFSLPAGFGFSTIVGTEIFSPGS